MKNRLTVQQAIEQLREGRQIILDDDEDRENEGDLCMASDKVTAEDINFMAMHGRGLICLTLTQERANRLGLTKMTERNESRFGTNFYTSIEAREGVTTGISAADRATTILAAVSDGASTHSVVSPGHVFPICARKGGVLVRSGQTEGSVDLARLAGLEPSGVICEIMKEDGTMARMPDLEIFAEEHNLGILTIAELIEYRVQRESLVTRGIETEVTPGGAQKPFRLATFHTEVNQGQYLALVLGNVTTGDPVLVRMHTSCVPGHVFHLATCGCEAKKARSLELIEEAGAGVFVYIHPGRLDLAAQVRRCVLKGEMPVEPTEEGIPAELRTFGLGAQVLASLGLSKIRLMTDNPKRIVGLKSYNLEVVEQVPLIG